MSDNEESTIVVTDKAARRRFIRRGASLVAMAGLASSAGQAYGDDCDRAQVGEKNAKAPGSDSDTGEAADATGCGRRPPPKISQRNLTDIIDSEKVEKIKA